MLTAVDYERNEIFEHVENRTVENQEGGRVMVDPRTSWSCLRTWEDYLMDNPGLKP